MLSEIDYEIDALEDRKEAIKAGIFEEASKDWYKMLSINFDSSSGKTEQYMTFCKVFRKQFKKLLSYNVLTQLLRYNVRKLPNVHKKMQHRHNLMQRK